MSLSLPIEDLPRLKVSARLSQDGTPILSLTLGGTPHQPRLCASSGIYVSLQTVVENGGSSLLMTTSIGDTCDDIASGHSGSQTPLSVTGMSANCYYSFYRTESTNRYPDHIPIIQSATSAVSSLTTSPIMPGNLKLDPISNQSEASSLLAWLDFQTPSTITDTNVNLFGPPTFVPSTGVF